MGESTAVPSANAMGYGPVKTLAVELGGFGDVLDCPVLHQAAAYYDREADGRALVPSVFRVLLIDVRRTAPGRASLAEQPSGHR